MTSEGNSVPTDVVGKADHYKALCDFAKHIATLSLGSLILAGTLIDKLLRHTDSRAVVGWGMTLLMVSMIASALAFLITAVRFPQADKPPLSEGERSTMAAAVIASFTTFALGVGSIAWVVWSGT